MGNSLAAPPPSLRVVSAAASSTSIQVMLSLGATTRVDCDEWDDLPPTLVIGDDAVELQISASADPAEAAATAGQLLEAVAVFRDALVRIAEQRR